MKDIDFYLNKAQEERKLKDPSYYLEKAQRERVERSAVEIQERQPQQQIPLSVEQPINLSDFFKNKALSTLTSPAAKQDIGSVEMMFKGLDAPRNAVASTLNYMRSATRNTEVEAMLRGYRGVTAKKSKPKLSTGGIFKAFDEGLLGEKNVSTLGLMENITNSQYDLEVADAVLKRNPKLALVKGTLSFATDLAMDFATDAIIAKGGLRLAKMLGKSGVPNSMWDQGYDNAIRSIVSDDDITRAVIQRNDQYNGMVKGFTNTRGVLIKIQDDLNKLDDDIIRINTMLEDDSTKIQARLTGIGKKRDDLYATRLKLNDELNRQLERLDQHLLDIYDEAELTKRASGSVKNLSQFERPDYYIADELRNVKKVFDKNRETLAKALQDNTFEEIRSVRTIPTRQRTVVGTKEVENVPYIKPKQDVKVTKQADEVVEEVVEEPVPFDIVNENLRPEDIPTYPARQTEPIVEDIETVNIVTNAEYTNSLVEKKLLLAGDMMDYAKLVRMELNDQIEMATKYRYIEQVTGTDRVTVMQEPVTAMRGGIPPLTLGKPKVEPKIDLALVNSMADTLSFGEFNKYQGLPLHHLRGLTDMIEAYIKAPKEFREGIHHLTSTITPPRFVFRRMGLESQYTKAVNGRYDIRIDSTERLQWMNGQFKGFGSMGHRYDDDAEEVVARFADEGARAVLPDRMYKKFSLNEINYLRNVAVDDKVRWDRLRDLAYDQKKLARTPEDARLYGIPMAQENYFFHRKGFHDQLKQTAADTVEMRSYYDTLYRKGVLRERVPKNITASQFFSRNTDELISYKWSEISSEAYYSELKKLHLEQPLKELESIVSAIPNPHGRFIREYAANWAREIRGMTVSSWDEKLNDAVGFASKWAEKVSRGKIQSRSRGYEQLSTSARKAIVFQTMWMNPKTAAKNFFQILHSGATIGARPTIAGVESVFSKGGRRVLGNSRIMMGRIPIDSFDIGRGNVIDTILNSGLAPNQFIDRYWNAASAYNGAVYKIINSKQKYVDDIARFAIKQGYSKSAVKGSRFWDLVADYFDAGYGKEIKDLAELNLQMTQWSYQSWDLPRFAWSQTGKTLGMFQTWSANYTTVFLPQMWKQIRYGKNVFNEADNMARINALTYGLSITALAAIGYKLGKDMTWLLPQGQFPTGRIGGAPVPFPVSPAISQPMAFMGYIVGHALDFATGHTTTYFPALAKASGNSLKYSLIPTSVKSAGNVKAVAEGTKGVGDIFFSNTAKKKKKASSYYKRGRGR